MKLVYAVIDSPANYTVRVTSVKQDRATIDHSQNLWNNEYSGGPKHFGQFKWWRSYRPGTVIGVYDIDDDIQLTRLSHLVSWIKEQDWLESLPSRESSI